ncbi:hypothetical protein FS837_008698 [Tulasnella sp. UAMH 9824]|nr:hypothetical protein FS837_008698 [Tulasnella sp. UAMH 9824]
MSAEQRHYAEAVRCNTAGQQPDVNASMHTTHMSGTQQRPVLTPIEGKKDIFHPDYETGQQSQPWSASTNKNGKRPENRMDEDDAEEPGGTPRPNRTSSSTQGDTPSQHDFGGRTSRAGAAGDGRAPPKIRRSSRTRSGSDNSIISHADDSPAPAPKMLTKEQEKEAKLAVVRQMLAGKDQQEDEGTISFPKQAYARSIHSSNLRGAYTRNANTCLLIADHLDMEGAMIWIQAYRSAKITTQDQELFKWGIGMMELKELVNSFKVSDYKMPTVPKDAKAILLLTSGPEATKRILANKILTFRAPFKSGTFFVQSNESWGSNIIADIHGGGTNFERDVLPHVWKTFSKYMLRVMGKTGKDNATHLAEFTYHKVPHSEKTHGDTNVCTWRIKFKYTSDAMTGDWELPRTIGNSNRGMIGCERTPHCSHCVSYSHQQSCCKWWKEGLMAGKETKPQSYLKVTWTKIASVNHKQLEPAAK